MAETPETNRALTSIKTQQQMENVKKRVRRVEDAAASLPVRSLYSE